MRIACDAFHESQTKVRARRRGKSWSMKKIKLDRGTLEA